MKILILLSKYRLPSHDWFYECLKKHAVLDIIYLDRKQQRNLKKIFKEIVIEKYDRIIFDLYFKCIVNQYRFIQTIPNLVMLEEDACQNYIQHSKRRGKFLQFYKKLNGFRLLCTSERLASRFRKEGIDACFLKKGYDESGLKNLEIKRDIEFGFIGRISSKMYTERKKLLVELEKNHRLQLIRTEPGIEYLQMLNRIKVFVSADIGLSEYMAKNFEAMACGCLVVAYRQGIEESALGLIDMENIVLYSNISELEEKILCLAEQPSLILEIAHKGQMLVEKNHRYEILANNLYDFIQKDIKFYPLQKSLFQRLFGV